MISFFQKLYKEDWEYDKHEIYYPVHITPGYEQALEANKFQSDVSSSKEIRGSL